VLEFDFLEAADGTPLTKKFSLENGQIEKEPYPMVRNVTSHRETAHDVRSFADILRKHSKLNHCLLKGLLSRSIENMSRAGLTSAEAPTRYLAIDLDFHEGWDSIDDFIAHLNPEWSNVSYVFQHSVSAGITGKIGMRGHLFILLEEAITPALAKQWLMERNLDQDPRLDYTSWLIRHEIEDNSENSRVFKQHREKAPTLYKKLALAANGLSLRWPLDITTCQNDKLIYIAPPILQGLDDPLGEERFVVSIKDRDFAPIPKLQHALATVEGQVQDAVAALRAQAGMEKRKPKLKSVGAVSVLTNPDRAVVTGSKVARGFVYLNLNGGDSWGYFFPEENPEIVRNFKNEPAVRLRDIDPEFYERYMDALRTKKLGDVRPYVFREPKRCAYYNVLYDKTTDQIGLMAKASSKAMLTDFMLHHYDSMPEPLEDWEMVFDPTITRVIAPKDRWINTFRPTDYIKAAPLLDKVDFVPPTIAKILASICGNDQESYDRFINWLAHLFQTRRRTNTSWIFHGVQGTGKGVLISKILRPLFGEQHVVQWTMQNFEEIYNSGLEKCLILFLDEFKANASKNVDIIMNKLKAYITEDIISCRGMRENEVQIPNWLNVIIASNHPDPIQIPEHDRRFNVAPAQEKALKITQGEIDAIENELPMFASFLWNFDVNTAHVRAPMLNAARELMIRASRTTIDEFFTMLQRGDFSWFLNFLRESMPLQDTVVYQQYEATIITWCRELLGSKDMTLRATRDELRSVFHYVIGTATTPAKFTRICNMHRMPLSNVWNGSRSAQGLALLMKFDEKEVRSVLETLTNNNKMSLVRSA
jgi:hypothetical protein